MSDGRRKSCGCGQKLKPFQFTIRTLLGAMAALAVVCAAMKSLGPNRSLWVGRGRLTVADLSSRRLGRSGKPGPKASGVVSSIAIFSLMALLWLSRAPRDSIEPASLGIFVGNGLIFTLFVVWLYSSCPCDNYAASPNYVIGFLSITWILDARTYSIIAITFRMFSVRHGHPGCTLSIRSGSRCHLSGASKPATNTTANVLMWSNEKGTKKPAMPE